MKIKTSWRIYLLESKSTIKYLFFIDKGFHYYWLHNM